MTRKLKGEYPEAKEILRLLLGGAVLAAVLVMPGVAAVLPRLKEPWDEFDIYRLRQNLRRLKRKGAISFSEKDGKTLITLTRKGKKEALVYNIERMKVEKPKTWDKKWRLVVFDIPEYKKKAREALRLKLKDLDFYRIQDSVFIYPYPCFSEIEFLRQNFEVKDEVSFFVVEKLEKEEEAFLRKYFQIRF
jgi:DNA-binding transcriptional regulator PaaX